MPKMADYSTHLKYCASQLTFTRLRQPAEV
jgi:hypothetical protein